MRILRLTNSDDLQANIPEHERSASVAARALEARFGQPVEVVSRVLWPTEKMPAMVAKWVRELEPDLVFVRIASYWVTYESVPLRMKRRFGRIGERAAGAGKASARISWLSQRWFYHLGRTWAVRTIGGDTLFTTDEVIPRLETAFRAILKDEAIGIVVRGPLTPFNTIGTAAGARRAARRMAELDARAQDLCDRLRIQYLRVAGREDPTDRSIRLGDRVHRNAEGQARVAEWEFEGLAAAWEAMIGATGSVAPHEGAEPFARPARPA